MWIVYSERFCDKGADRWFYGAYKDRDKANAIAHGLNFTFKDIADGYYCVAEDKDPIVETIQNMNRMEYLNA